MEQQDSFRQRRRSSARNDPGSLPVLARSEATGLDAADGGGVVKERRASVHAVLAGVAPPNSRYAGSLLHSQLKYRQPTAHVGKVICADLYRLQNKCAAARRVRKNGKSTQHGGFS